MKSFSESLIAVNGLASNVYFFRDTGYFAPDATLLGIIETGTNTANCAFGDDDGRYCSCRGWQQRRSVFYVQGP